MSAGTAFTRTWSVGRYTATLSCPRPHRGALVSAVFRFRPTFAQARIFVQARARGTTRLNAGITGATRREQRKRTT